MEMAVVVACAVLVGFVLDRQWKGRARLTHHLCALSIMTVFCKRKPYWVVLKAALQMSAEEEYGCKRST